MTTIRTKTVLLSSVFSAALLGTPIHASAADLDTLSDDDLLARIERLEKIIGPGEVNAQRNGNDKIRVTFTGQFHRTAIVADDGEDTFGGVFDNTNLSSRVRWRISGDLNDDISVRGLIEADADPGTTTAAFSQDQINIGGGNIPGTFSLRHSAVTLVSKTFGALTLGQTNTTSNGSTEADFSGTGFILYPSQSDVGGNVQLRTSDGSFVDVNGNIVALENSVASPGGPPVNIEQRDFTGDFDGTNRDDVIRYDTPRIGGVVLSASFTNGASYAVGGNYSNDDLAGFGVNGRIAYSNIDGQGIGGAPANGEVDLVSGSIAAIHNATGFNAAFAFGVAGEDATAANSGGTFTGTSLSNSLQGVIDNGLATESDGGTQFYGKLGWRRDVTGFGATSIAADVSFNRDVAVDDSRYRGIGVALNQTFDNIATDVYVGYRNVDITESGITGVAFEDINYFFGGVRTTF